MCLIMMSPNLVNIVAMSTIRSIMMTQLYFLPYCLPDIDENWYVYILYLKRYD